MQHPSKGCVGLIPSHICAQDVIGVLSVSRMSDPITVLFISNFESRQIMLYLGVNTSDEPQNGA